MIVEIPLIPKAEAAILCKEAGRQIDRSDEHSKNEFASIRVSLERESNVNDESDL
jgi:hypothetical protein